MRLRELLDFEEIVIQCHDNPDADALASGFALYTYLSRYHKKVSFIYGGKNIIRKSNLVLMIKELEIPVTYCESMEAPELLVTVDCRYGEGNVTKFPAKNIAVIDHHRVTGVLPRLNEVRSNLGSCATLLWQLLKDEGFDVNANKKLATAMYYGLYTDTNELTEVSHPLDKDLRDEADFIPSLITRFRNANLSLEELDIAGAALLRSDYNEDYRFAVVKAGACDPNILGIISDLVLAVDSVDTCLVFCVTPTDVKLSVRSCIKEVKASELAQAICEGIGSGGGHYVKAGGRVSMDSLTREYIKYCENQQLSPRMELAQDGNGMRPTASAIKFFLEHRIREYFDNSDIVYASKEMPNEDKLQTYALKQVKLGYIKPCDLFPIGTKIIVRTMHGDMDMEVKQGMIMLIGVKGDIYILGEKDFNARYMVLDERLQQDMAEYKPTIKNNTDSRILYLLEIARTCMAKTNIEVKAKYLERKTKLFTRWNEDEYITGNKGDYLIIHGNEEKELDIMDGKLFTQYYFQ